MARSNTGSTANRATTTGNPVANVPITLACWFNPANLTTNQNLVFVRENTTSGTPHYVGIAYDGANASAQGDNVVLAITGSTDEVYGISSTGGTANTWMHCAGVFASATSRIAFRDGVAGTTGTTSRPLNTLNTGTGNGTDIGIINVAGSFFSPLNGSIAEIGVWNVALTASEIASLAKGASPLLIRPANLVFYTPFSGRGTDRDVRSNRAITITGTLAQAAHPPAIKGSLDAFIPVPDAGGGTPATASGATVTEQGSLVTGAATGAATGATATVALNTTLIAGAATGAASAAAATVTQARALVSGAATGAASVATVTVTEQESILVGSATGAAAGAAVTLSPNTSFIAGAASGAAVAASATVSEAASIIAGAATTGGAGTASGVTVSEVASLVAGVVTGAASAPAATVTEAAALLAGTAVSGSGGAQSAVAPPVRASFDGTGVVFDATSPTFDAESTRVLPWARFALVPGAAAVNSVGQGATFTATISLIAGTAVADSAPIAAGATFTAATTLITGAASSEIPAMVSGAELTLASGLIAGAATGAVTTPAAVTWDATTATWDTTGVTFDVTAGAPVTAFVIGAPTYSFIAGTAIGASSAAGVTFETRAFFMGSPANVLDAPGTAQGALVTAVMSLEPGRARGQGWRKHPHGGPPWATVDKPGGEWTTVAKPGGAWDRAA